MEIRGNMGNTHIHNTNKKVKEIGCTVALVALSPFVDDDRVTCDQCQHRQETEADEFVDLERAKQLRSMGKRLGMAGDKFEQKGKWLRIHWTEASCQATGLSPQPSQLKHRCHLYSKATAQPSSVESDAWWLN
jgi:hypothetical protein